MEAADEHRVPAGSALAVDRVGFSEAVEARITAHPLIQVERAEVKGLPPADWGPAIIATGPLTSPDLAAGIAAVTGEDALAFFDAIAPIVHRDSIDFDKAWFQSRYDKSDPNGDGADYINCPLDRGQYEVFVNELLSGDKIAFHEWEQNTPYFEGCMPVEVMASRGPETLRHGPLKPVGLTNPHNPDKPYAVIQLRQDNKLGTLYNIDGFQTKLRHGEQVRILRSVPGLEKAEFARLGGLHRNTFINGPKLLTADLRLKNEPRLRFAGQITGVEGYVESTAMGLLAARFLSAELTGQTCTQPPLTTALGALLSHVTGGGDAKTFQPMNVNFGLFPPPAEVVNKAGKLRPLKGVDRRRAMTARAAEDFINWLPS
jgi:methylenetetrahydrofolate--tRNA-(uracil-5-)-methyltransferase